MKFIFLAILIMVDTLSCFGQSQTSNITQHVVAEGKRLYRSEMASWYGTDIFVEQFKDQAKIGGYFSYQTKAGGTCVFFSKADAPVVIGTIAFDSTYNVGTAKTSLTERSFTTEELTLYTIRTNALAAINQDTLFKKYQNTHMNIVPMVSEGEKKVYVLTATSKDGIVIFGNDYRLTFDAGNKMVSAEPLHKGIIPIKYGKTEGGEIILETMHTHLPRTHLTMTSTDICTLMLYSKATKWKRHTVVMQDYISVWNCESNQLALLKQKAIDKIGKEEKRQSKR